MGDHGAAVGFRLGGACNITFTRLGGMQYFQPSRRYTTYDPPLCVPREFPQTPVQ
jgi:hypothetical protein